MLVKISWFSRKEAVLLKESNRPVFISSVLLVFLSYEFEFMTWNCMRGMDITSQSEYRIRQKWRLSIAKKTNWAGKCLWICKLSLCWLSFSCMQWGKGRSLMRTWVWFWFVVCVLNFAVHVACWNHKVLECCKNCPSLKAFLSDLFVLESKFWCCKVRGLGGRLVA